MSRPVGRSRPPGVRAGPLREIRATRGLTQLQVAVMAGVTPHTVTKIEAGDVSTLYLRSLVAVAHALGLAPSEILFFKGQKTI